MIQTEKQIIMSTSEFEAKKQYNLGNTIWTSKKSYGHRFEMYYLDANVVKHNTIEYKYDRNVSFESFKSDDVYYYKILKYDESYTRH